MNEFRLNNSHAWICNSQGDILSDEQDRSLCVPANRLLNELFDNNLGILPAAVRWVSDTSPPALVFERLPEVKTILYKDVVYDLNMPWMLYFLYPQDGTYRIQVRCRTTQVFTMEEELFIPPLPGICSTGDMESFSTMIRPKIGEHLHHIVSAFYEHLYDREIQLDLVPDSWGTFESTDQVLQHWSGLNKDDVVFNTEYASLSDEQDASIGKMTHNLLSQMDEPFKVNYETLHMLIGRLVEQGYSQVPTVPTEDVDVEPAPRPRRFVIGDTTA